MTPIITVTNLSKKYRIGESQPYITLRDTIAGVFSNPLKSLKDGLRQDEFWALKDINFTVEPGEVVGIIGHNGAGKSTLLKILSRITPPTTGEITLRGRVGSLLEVGTGFQQELTGRENIFLNGAILGMTQAEIKKKFDEIVDFAEVEKFIDTPVKHYSSGMYMRLAFSIAAHLDPEILIVDEVLAVGDAEFQKKCLGKMDEVSKKQGKTVLFVSHDMQAVNKLCDRLIYLRHGLIYDQGDKNLVIKRINAPKQHRSNHLVQVDNEYLKNISLSITGKNKIISTFDNFIINIKLSFKYKLKYQIAISISTEENELLCWIYDHTMTYYSSEKFQEIFIEVIKNMLYPGKYRVGIWIGQFGNITVFYENNSVMELIIHDNSRYDIYNKYGSKCPRFYQPYTIRRT